MKRKHKEYSILRSKTIEDESLNNGRSKLLDKFNGRLFCEICNCHGESFGFYDQKTGYQIICYKTIDGKRNKVFLTNDHIIPSSKKNKDEKTKLQTLCNDCNSRIKQDKIKDLEYFKIQYEYEKEYGQESRFLEQYRKRWHDARNNNFGWSF